jgi:hypothetical protein
VVVVITLRGADEPLVTPAVERPEPVKPGVAAVDPWVMVAVRRSPTRPWDRRVRARRDATAAPVVAVVVERDDHRCSVSGSAVWRALSSADDDFADRHQAMRAVEIALDTALVWREIGPCTWAASPAAAPALAPSTA